MSRSDPDRPPVTTATGTPAPAARPLRRDAAENRERLVRAAARVFAEHGLDATVEEVAREAGVGMGTLYRRFAHKQALVDELVGGVRRTLAALARDALDAPDGTGLERLMFATGALQAEQPGCLQQLWTHSDAEMDALREYREVVAELLVRAKRAQRIRPDVAGTDVTMIVWAVRGVIETSREVAPEAWRRHLEVSLAGLRPPGAGPFDGPLRESPLAEADARSILDAHRPG